MCNKTLNTTTMNTYDCVPIGSYNINNNEYYLEPRSINSSANSEHNSFNGTNKLAKTTIFASTSTNFGVETDKLTNDIQKQTIVCSEFEKEQQKHCKEYNKKNKDLAINQLLNQKNSKFFLNKFICFVLFLDIFYEKKLLPKLNIEANATNYSNKFDKKNLSSNKFKNNLKLNLDNLDNFLNEINNKVNIIPKVVSF